MTRLIALAATVSAFAFTATPALAQDAAGDRVNTVIVYGDDECEESTEESLVICVRYDESERFRIPQPLRRSDSPENQSWADRVRSFEAVGDFGPLSCTPSGAGGELGCLTQIINAAYQERREGSDVRAAELIAAAREERLATIDAEAAATQARVEELERQYMERLEREEAGEVAPRPQNGEPVVVSPEAIAPR